MRKTIHIYIELLRVKQWLKNFFLFFPLIFSGNYQDVSLWCDCFLAVLGFSLSASGVYIINDILDITKDKHHPKKSQRPVVSGQVSLFEVWIIVSICFLLGLLICMYISVDLLKFVMLYVLLQVFYNAWAKKVVVLDVLVVAFGFLLRVLAGAAAVSVSPSMWLQMCVFVLALFLGFTKRSHELDILKGQSAVDHRQVLKEYTKPLLDQLILICSTLCIVFYGLYTIAPEITSRAGGYQLVYSIGFVIYGIFRYLYLVNVNNLGDDPSEVLLTDKPLLLNILLWIIFVVCFIKPVLVS